MVEGLQRCADKARFARIEAAMCGVLKAYVRRRAQIVTECPMTLAPSLS